MFIEHSFGPPDYRKLLQSVCLDEQSPGRQTCSQSPPFPRGLCKQPSQISLSPVFQSCSSQVPDHLTKSFATIDPYPWTYLAPKCIIKPTTQSSAPGDFPSLLSSISGAIMPVDSLVKLVEFFLPLPLTMRNFPMRP